MLKELWDIIPEKYEDEKICLYLVTVRNIDWEREVVGICGSLSNARWIASQYNKGEKPRIEKWLLEGESSIGEEAIHG